MDKRVVTNPFTGEVVETTENIFCPTGEGGGVDPSCSSKSSGGKLQYKKTVGGGWQTEYKGVQVSLSKGSGELEGLWLASAERGGERFTSSHEKRDRAVRDLVEIGMEPI